MQSTVSRPLRGWPRADEVTTVYKSKNTRTTIGKAIKKRGGNEIWSMILFAIDSGLLTETAAVVETPNLRILLPDAHPGYCRKFDLTTSKDRERIRQVVLPAVLVQRGRFIDNPEELPSIVHDYHKTLPSTNKVLSTCEIEAPPNALNPGEQEIVMYGVQLWPRPEQEWYDYKQLRSGIWWFNDLLRWICPGENIASRALLIRHTIGHLHLFARHEFTGENREKAEKLAGVVLKLSRLLEQNPQGQCRFPPPRNHENEAW